MPAAIGQMWWAYVLLGLVCGVFSGTFGIGASIIMVPALGALFAIPQKSAQGVALAVMVPMALVGAIRYKMNPQIVFYPSTAAVVACGAVVGAVFGAALAGWASGAALRKLFAVIMVVAAARLFFSSPPPQTSTPPGAAPPSSDVTGSN